MKAPAAMAAILACSAVFSAASLAQNLYKSIGPDGKVVYSDRPPAEGRLEKTMQFKNLPSTSLSADQLEKMRRQNAGSQAAIPSGQAVIYTTAWCGYCKKAKSYMSSKGISYREVDIETDHGLAAYAKAGGGKGVPLLQYRGQSVQGFSVEAYEALFGRKG